MENQSSKKIISIVKLRDFIRNPNLAPLEKCLLLNLYFYAGVTGTAYPSQKTLANDFGYKDGRHIRTYLNKLKEKKWILSWKKRGYSKSNSYVLNGELYFHNDKTIGKSASVDSGTVLPVQSGTPFPPKINQESNQLSSSHVQQLFEKTSKMHCDPSDKRRLEELCKQYSEQLVEDVIKEVATRKLPFFKVGLIANILNDWSIDGKPKPPFASCGKDDCLNGYIMQEEIAKLCQCKRDYENQPSYEPLITSENKMLLEARDTLADKMSINKKHKRT